ncbi:MAG TPA: UDP-galactose-lipid carrier transferase [Chloroflexi bacterium]|nr:UDP-galactose-lipid carrier transferase [Chloroflexota bacterium]
MLEKVDLTKKLSKSDYKVRMPQLRRRLYDLQKACWDASIPSVIIFEGWDAAGKGTSINVLSQRLDPRGFKLHAVQAPRTYETHMPWLWRFWQKLPNYGEMAIFDRSWYGRVLVERVESLTPEEEWRKGYRDIINFERTIADDGYVVIKFWLHISKKEQQRRFKKLEKDPLESWHVQPEDWEHHRKYEQYVLAIEEMLERTDTEWGPWTIVEATNRFWARAKIFETIIQRLEEALQARGLDLPAEPPSDEETVEPEAEQFDPAQDEERADGALTEMSLAELGLTPRVVKALQQAQVTTVGGVVKRLAAGDEGMLELDGIGLKSLAEIKQRLASLDESQPSAGGEGEEEELC